jgi:hypothetical protein
MNASRPCFRNRGPAGESPPPDPSSVRVHAKDSPGVSVPGRVPFPVPLPRSITRSPGRTAAVSIAQSRRPRRRHRILDVKQGDHLRILDVKQGDHLRNRFVVLSRSLEQRRAHAQRLGCGFMIVSHDQTLPVQQGQCQHSDVPLGRRSISGNEERYERHMCAHMTITHLDRRRQPSDGGCPLRRPNPLEPHRGLVLAYEAGC